MSLFMCLSSCKDDGTEDLSHLSPYEGEAQALKEGEVWNPEVIAIRIPNSNTYWLYMDGFGEQNNMQERLSFKLPEDSTGSFTVYRVQDRTSDSVRLSYREFLGHGDVIGNGYDVDTTVQNLINVRSFNEESLELSGTFEVTVVLDDDLGYFNDPIDTLHFSEGTFRTVLKDKWK